MLLTVLPVAIFAAFTVPATVDALFVFVKSAESYNGDFLMILSAFGIKFDWLTLLLHVVLVLISAVCLSYSYIAVYRHFRTGKLSIRSPLPYVNSGFIPVLISILILYVFSALINFVLGCVAALADAIVGHFALPYGLFLAIVYFILLVQMVAYGTMISIPLKVLPGMCIYGYSMMEAWTSTNRVLDMVDKGKRRRIVISVVLPFVAFVVISTVNALLWNLTVIVAVLYALIISYYTVLSHILTFGLSQFERRDVTGYKER